MKKCWIQSGILACGLILGFLLGSARGNEFVPPAPPPRQESAWIIIQQDEKNEAWKFAPQEEKSLFDTMEILEQEEKIEMKTQDFPGLGVMIEELEGKKNGEKGNYWQYWINETYAKVGADTYIPRGGDIVEWQFTPHHNQENQE